MSKTDSDDFAFHRMWGIVGAFAGIALIVGPASERTLGLMVTCALGVLWSTEAGMRWAKSRKQNSRDTSPRALFWLSATTCACSALAFAVAVHYATQTGARIQLESEPGKAYRVNVVAYLMIVFFPVVCCFMTGLSLLISALETRTKFRTRKGSLHVRQGMI